MSDEQPEGKASKLRKRLIRKKPKKRRVRLTRSANPQPDAPKAAPEEADEDVASEDEPSFFEDAFDADIDPNNPVESVRDMVGGIVQAILPDLIKRAVASGGEALTEEAVRGALDEASLPDGVAGFVAAQSGSVRGELSRIVSAEIQRFLKTVNISGEIQKILTAMTFEIRTEIRFKPNDDNGLRPSVKNKVRVKRSKDD